MGIGLATVGELGEGGLCVGGAIKVDESEGFVDEEIGVEVFFLVDDVEDGAVLSGLEKPGDPVVAGLDIGVVVSSFFLEAVGLGEEAEAVEVADEELEEGGVGSGCAAAF